MHPAKTPFNPPSATDAVPDLDVTRAAEIEAVVAEATQAQDFHFLEGLEYGLILAGLHDTPLIREAWATGQARAERRQSHVE